MAEKSKSKQSKVAKLIDVYELDGLEDQCEDRWTRKENRSSLRDLAKYFNHQLLDTALHSASAEPLDGEVDNLYRHLTNDDVTSGVRQETRSRLEQHGIDVDSLENDFVSYQAIRTYLRNYRDVSPPDESESDSPETHRERKRATIQQLTSRLARVTTDALAELTNAGHLTLGEFDVLITVRVHCSDCNTRLSITDLLRQGGCKCDNQEV